jgi:ATP-dependent DNA helicase 2 subunit 2
MGSGIIVLSFLEGSSIDLGSAQVPFADDLRKFTFRSLDRLVSKKGEEITKHPHLPTNEQLNAMDKFVDAMDLMHAGEKDDNG